MTRRLSFFVLAAFTLTALTASTAVAKSKSKAKAPEAAKPVTVGDGKSVTIEKLRSLAFGITGYSGQEEARSNALTLQNFMTEKLGRDVVTRVYPNPAALAWGIAVGEVDFAWLQPLTLVEAQKQGTVTPIVKAVRHGLPFYRGVLFTTAEKKVQALSGLQGMTVAWVDPKSSAGYLFPRAAILAAGLKPAKLFKSETFAGDHAAVCKAVSEGKVDVGATYADDRPGSAMAIDGCLQSIGVDATKKLVIVTKSQPIPNDAIAARPGLDSVEIERVKKMFLELAKDPKGQRVMLSVFKATAFDNVGDDDFAPVRFAAESAEATDKE
jgi:phosphonate transport system substrate-binding protein